MTAPNLRALILGREPAVIAHVIAAGLAVVSLAVPLSPGYQAAFNAVIVAAAGLYTAWRVNRDRLLPALTGLAQAGLGLALAYGAELSAQDQTTVVAFVAALAGLWLRGQLTAPVDRKGRSVQ